MLSGQPPTTDLRPDASASASSRPDPDEDDGVWSPFVMSIVLAAGYCLFCCAYIILSTHEAALVSASVSQLEGIELLKGLAFVLLTGLLFLVFAWLAFSRIEAQRQLARKQRRMLVDVDQRALAGLFAGSIAHDINNLLTVAQCQLGQLSEQSSGHEERSFKALEESLSEIAKLSLRLAKIGHQQPRGEWGIGSITNSVKRAIEISRQHVRVKTCVLSSRLSDVPPRSLNSMLLMRAVINLILNAAEATAGRGRIEVLLFTENESIVIEVHDSGPGVPETESKSVFEEYYTTKPDGTGLGLVVVSVCAREHGGRAEVCSSPLGGACFRVTLSQQ